MDVLTRWIVRFGVEPAHIDGISVCRMFNRRDAVSLFPSSGAVSTCIRSWIDSPAITTGDVSMLDWAHTHPSSDAAEPCANRRISMTSRGSPTVVASSTRQLLRNQQFAIVT